MPEKAAKVRISRGRPTAAFHFRLLNASVRNVHTAAATQIPQRFSTRPKTCIGNRYRNPRGIAASICQSAIAIKTTRALARSRSDLVLFRNRREAIDFCSITCWNMKHECYLKTGELEPKAHTVPLRVGRRAHSVPHQLC